ncbi:MAG: nucleotidyltransferase domain-containing protein [Sedimenticola sp.]
MADLASLLFKNYRRRVLGLLLLHPDEAYHVREIARLTGTVAGTLHKELSRLSEAGVLLNQRRGNQLLYRANRDCPVFEELAGILRKTSGLVDVLAEGLWPLADRITVALVFGSMASGKANAASDVDLLVLGDVGFAEVVKCLHPLQQQLGREINPKVYTLTEWNRLVVKRQGFATEVMDKPKLFVIGSKDDIG